MKIGILTFHFAHNYGAVLQTYALKSYFRKFGHDVSVINYRNKTIAERYKKKLPMEYNWKSYFHLHLIKRVLKSRIKTRIAQSSWYGKCKKFDRFINNIILDGNNHIYNIDEIEKENVDIFVAGSDQIWNKYLTGGNDSVYFLDFNTCAKKVFYGASNGYSMVEAIDEAYYKRIVNNSDYISTRENILSEYLQRLTNTDIYTVVDPTLLLDVDDYNSVMTVCKIPPRFIFAYYIVEDCNMTKAVKYLSRVLSIPIIELHYYKGPRFKKNQKADMGPGEFLYYIKNSDFVITNSFHGTIFSIIYNKLFYSYYRNDVRKDNLLKELGLANRHIYSLSDIDLNDTIDYSVVCNKLNEYRETSKKYICNFLSN